MKRLKGIKGSVMDLLTEKQKVFVIEYAADGDRVRAMKEAGYKGNNGSLSAQANQLLKNEKVSQALLELKQPYMDQAKLNIADIARQLQAFVYCDIIQYTDEDGFLTCAPKDLPPHVRQCIHSLNKSERYDKEGNLVSKKYRVEIVSKIKAVELVMKHLGMLQPDVTNIGSVQVNIQQVFEEMYKSCETEPETVDEIIQKELRED